MKLLRSPKPYQAKIRQPIPARLKKWAIIFLASNLLSWLLLPGVFYGFWDTIGGICGKIAHQRAYYHVKRTRGRTIADVWELQKDTGEFFKEMANFEFLK